MKDHFLYNYKGFSLLSFFFTLCGGPFFFYVFFLLYVGDPFFSMFFSLLEWVGGGVGIASFTKISVGAHGDDLIVCLYTCNVGTARSSMCLQQRYTKLNIIK